MDIRLTKTVGTDITNLYFSEVNILQFIFYKSKLINSSISN